MRPGTALSCSSWTTTGTRPRDSLSQQRTCVQVHVQAVHSSAESQREGPKHHHHTDKACPPQAFPMRTPGTVPGRQGWTQSTRNLTGHFSVLRTVHGPGAGLLPHPRQPQLFPPAPALCTHRAWASLTSRAPTWPQPDCRESPGVPADRAGVPSSLDLSHPARWVLKASGA